MKEEWLFHGAVVPIDVETTAALVAEIKRLIDVIGGMALAQPESDYERGFIDGMQKQMQSSVDKAVNAMTQPTYYIPSKDQRTWVGLTDEEIDQGLLRSNHALQTAGAWRDGVEWATKQLKEKNT